MGFGVTYEGLKHAEDYETEELGSRFGVTYEGLKPPMAYSNQIITSVLELPMRV